MDRNALKIGLQKACPKRTQKWPPKVHPKSGPVELIQKSTQKIDLKMDHMDSNIPGTDNGSKMNLKWTRK